MTVYLALLLVGTTFGLVLTPLVSRGSSRLGLLDAPGGRKVHSISVPRLGGLAILVAAILAFAVVSAAGFRAETMQSRLLREIAPILTGAALVFLIGVLDDVRTLPAWPK